MYAVELFGKMLYLIDKFSITPGCFSSSAFSSSNDISPLPSSSADSNNKAVRLSKSSSLSCRELSSMHDLRTVFNSSISIVPLSFEKILKCLDNAFKNKIKKIKKIRLLNDFIRLQP